MRKKAVRKDKVNGTFLKYEEVRGVRCEVWKKAIGGSTTFRWIDNTDDFPITRSTICVSNRPATVHHRIKDGEAYVNTWHGRLFFRDFIGITPIKIDRWEFKHGCAESAFGGYLIDAGSFARMNGDRIYVARSWW